MGAACCALTSPACTTSTSAKPGAICGRLWRWPNRWRLVCCGWTRSRGLATGDMDGGVSQRVLGTLLTWMAERTAPVFMVATANAIDRLPPELLRKGRFDELFFVDLPDLATRGDFPNSPCSP